MVNVDKIKSLAKEQGIKLGFICSQLGLTESYFRSVKQGKNKISDERLSIIADILNTTPEYLRDETDQKEKSATEEKPLPDILYRYNELSEDKQREVVSFIEFKLAQQKKKPDDYIGQIAAFGSGPVKIKGANQNAVKKAAALAQKRKAEKKKK